MSWIKSPSTRSSSLQPSSSVTPAPQNKTRHSKERTRMIASASSAIKRSAYFLRLVNSNGGWFFWFGGVDMGVRGQDGPILTTQSHRLLGIDESAHFGNQVSLRDPANQKLIIYIINYNDSGKQIMH